MPPFEIISATIIVIAYFYFVVFKQGRSTPKMPRGKIHAKFKGNNKAIIDLDKKTMEITNEKNEKRMMDIEEVHVTPSPPQKN